MRPPYGDVNLDVIHEIAMEARRLGVAEDRIRPGSDLAKTLANCDRFLEIMAQEIERLRQINDQALGVCDIVMQHHRLVGGPKVLGTRTGRIEVYREMAEAARTALNAAGKTS